MVSSERFNFSLFSVKNLFLSHIGFCFYSVKVKKCIKVMKLMIVFDECITGKLDFQII